MFGELALNQAISRTATIVCETEACLLLLTAEDYNEAFKIIVQREKTEKMLSIMSSIPNMESLLEKMPFESIVYSLKVSEDHSRKLLSIMENRY